MYKAVKEISRRRCVPCQETTSIDYRSTGMQASMDFFWQIMRAIWACDFFVMPSFSKYHVKVSPILIFFKLHVERRLEGLFEHSPRQSTGSSALTQRCFGDVPVEPLSISGRLLATSACIFLLLS